MINTIQVPMLVIQLKVKLPSSININNNGIANAQISKTVESSFGIDL